MNITLSPEMERYVAEKVKAGQYDSASAVIEDALSSFRGQEEFVAEDPHLRSLVAEGVEQVRRGEVSPLDMDEIIAKVEHLREQDRKAR
jgi:antitoxin ParD1/3/4